MHKFATTRRRGIAAAMLLAAFTVCAQAQPADPPHQQQPPPAQAEPNRLPPDTTTHHALELPGRTLHFAATAGTIRLTDAKNTPQADLAYIAYQLDGADPHTRPVTFVFNGGPGMASGWLQVGAVGPWRLHLGADAPIPSASPDPIPNAETWLDFTDLVFIDPAGTGYSRIVAQGDEPRRHFWSVEGDIDSLADMIRRWIDRNERSISPKYLLGESYGGFRAPRLARRLESEQGTGIAGMILVSPALDFGGRSRALDPLYWAARLPSMTAAARAADGGKIDRAKLADAEQYARTDYVTDLLRGPRDQAAVARASERVAALTGLDAALVRRYQGRLDTNVFLHEIGRAQGRVASAYDATVSTVDPFPHDTLSDYADPLLIGMQPSITSAMMAIYAGQLHWKPDTVYHLANNEAGGHWDWGRSLVRPESVSPMQVALALDPHLRVLIAHGLFDLVTPYFGTVLLLDDMPDLGGDRVKLAVYPGGHMFYTEDASRAAFRDAAQEMFRAPP